MPLSITNNGTTDTLPDFSHPHTLQRWRHQMKEAKANYYEYWINILGTPARDQDKADIQNRLTQLQDVGLPKDATNSLVQLMKIKSLEISEDLRQTKLLKDAVSNFGDFMHFEIEPPCSVRLTDWSIHTRTSSVPQDRLEFKFAARPPAQARQVTMGLYLRPFMWLQHLLQALESVIELVEERNSMTGLDSTGLTCDSRKGFHRMSELVYKIFEDWIRASELTTSMSIADPIGGRHVEVRLKSSKSFTLEPYMVFNSKMHGCYNGSYEDCKAECMRDRVFAECFCIPWNLANSSEWQSEDICNEQCATDRISLICNDECQKKINDSCHLQFTHLNEKSSSNFGYSLEHLKLMQIKASITELYPYAEILAEPKFTQSFYLSLLAGAIELWSATDVLGLLHLFVVIVAASVGAILKLNRVQPTVKPHEQFASPEGIEQKYTDELLKLRSQLKSNSRWTRIGKWLRGNSFYEQTPFTGYAYIVSSQSLIEVVLWYVVIGLFATFAAYNIGTTFQDYIAQITTLEMMPKVSEGQLPNLKLKMVLPLLLLNPYNPNMQNINLEQKGSLWGALTNVDQEFDVGSISAHLFESWREQLESLPWSQLIFINKSMTESNTSSLAHLEDMFTQWREGLEELKWPQLVAFYVELYSGPTTAVDGLFFELLLLEAIKSGEIVGANRTASEGQILQEIGCTMEELFADINSRLSSVLSLRGARTQLTDIDLSDKLLQKHSFGFEMELNFEAGLAESSLMVDAHTLSWLNKLVDIDDALNSYSTSKKMSMEEEILNFVLMLNALQYVWHFDLNSYATVNDPNSNLPQITVHVQSSQECAVVTQWTFTSEKNTCTQRSQLDCVEKCLVEEYLLSCDCLPWWVSNRNQHLICDKPCVLQREKCEADCRSKICPTSVLEIVSNSKPKHVSHTFEIKLRLMQNLHMHFMETYQNSIGTFLAQIGALLEFWVGFNVFALVHCITYIIGHTYKSFFQNGIEGSRDLERLERARQSLTDLSEQSRLDIKKLYEAATAGTLSVGNKQSKFQWLYQNSFFETTTITGFQFIITAKSITEKSIWISIIFFFCFITAANVYGAIARYRSCPTIISAKIVHQNGLAVSNLSVKIQQSMLQFTDQYPTSLRYIPIPDLTKHSPSIFEQFVCDLLDVNEEVNRYAEEVARYETVLYKWHYPYNKWKLKGVELSDDPQRQSPEEILKSWSSLISKGSLALRAFWERNKNKPYPGKLEEREAIAFELLDLLDAPLKERTLSHSHAFLMLEAFNNGHDPQQKFHELMLQDAGHVYNEPTGETLDQLLAGVTGLDLVRLMEQEMDKIILVRVIDEPLAKISLQNWQCQPTITSNNPHAIINQELQFHITLPEDSQRTEVHIVVHSFVRMWHNKVIETINSHQNTMKKLTCSGKSADLTELIELDRVNFDYMINPVSELPNDMELTTDNLNVANIKRLSSSQMNLLSNVAFDSSTHNCSTVSLRQCLDSCQVSYSSQTCGCQPWGLLYLEQSGQVCTEPCPEATHCTQECDLLIQHHCHYVVSTIETESVDQVEESEDFEYDVIIRKKSSSHVTYTETYESFGSLLTHVAGFLELWLSINLISIIHLGIYVIRTLIQMTRKRVEPESEESPFVRLQSIQRRIGGNLEQLDKEIQLKMVEIKKRQKQ